MYLLLRLLLNALAVIIVARVVPGIAVTSYLSAFFAGLAIAIINAPQIACEMWSVPFPTCG